MVSTSLRALTYNLLALIGAILAVQCAFAAPADQPQIQTNESYIEKLQSSATLPLEDPRAMFVAIFATLRDRIKIFPTENYYYFSFYQNGLRYSGNIRLAASDRDAGKLHFAYFEDFSAWHSRPAITHVVLDQSDGVMVERAAPLNYRVSFHDKTVLFELNDLTDVKPPASLIAPQERYIGPIFDELAMRFFLVFNPRLKVFHYILDETAKLTDKLVPTPQTDRILIGMRTGFAYYQDHFLDRKILIGVFDANVYANNYLDGPFDQLPDNFIKGEILRDSIVEAEPDLAGKIDRFGNFIGGTARYLIAPYLRYQHESDLLKFHKCALRTRGDRHNYHRCFVATAFKMPSSRPHAHRSFAH